MTVLKERGRECEKKLNERYEKKRNRNEDKNRGKRRDILRSRFPSSLNDVIDRKIVGSIDGHKKKSKKKVDTYRSDRGQSIETNGVDT